MSHNLLIRRIQANICLYIGPNDCALELKKQIQKEGCNNQHQAEFINLTMVKVMINSGDFQISFF